MTSKEYYCDKNEGCIQIKFSKQEMGRKNVIADCEYIKTDKDVYDVTIYIGILDYEGMEVYKVIQIDSNYGNLKQTLISYFKENLNSDTIEEITEIIDKRVRPTYIQSIDQIGKILKCVDINNKTYFIYELPDKTSVYLENKEIATLDGVVEQTEIIRIISDYCLKENSI